MPLRWIAILHDQVDASLALSGGIHGPRTCSRPCWPAPTSAWSPRCSTSKGVGHARTILDDLSRLDGGEGVRVGRAAEGQHEPGELPRPRRLRTRQLHEGPHFVHRQADLGRVSRMLNPARAGSSRSSLLAGPLAEPRCDRWPGSAIQIAGARRDTVIPLIDPCILYPRQKKEQGHDREGVAGVEVLDFYIDCQ